MKTIDYQVDADSIAILTIDVKGKPMNVMTPGYLSDIAEVGEMIGSDEKVKGAVITSGKDSFMAGADLKGIVDHFQHGADVSEVYA